MTELDYMELQRLAGMGMQRVLCDVSGQRGAVDNLGHMELVTEGTLMSVTPFSPMNIQDALRAGKQETNMGLLSKEDYEKAVELREKGANYVHRNARGNLFATEEEPIMDGVPSFSLRSVILGVEKRYFGFIGEKEKIVLEEVIEEYERANGLPLRAGVNNG